jgi:hypothetical protein
MLNGLWNYLRGRKRAIWVSASGDLRYDVLRDFKDIGAAGQINVHSLKQIRYGDVMAIEGVVFLTYAILRSAPQSGHSRLKQLLQCCGEDFDGVIVFFWRHHVCKSYQLQFQVQQQTVCVSFFICLINCQNSMLETHAGFVVALGRTSMHISKNKKKSFFPLYETH